MRELATTILDLMGNPIEPVLRSARRPAHRDLADVLRQHQGPGAARLGAAPQPRRGPPRDDRLVPGPERRQQHAVLQRPARQGGTLTERALGAPRVSVAVSTYNRSTSVARAPPLPRGPDARRRSSSRSCSPTTDRATTPRRPGRPCHWLTAATAGRHPRHQPGARRRAERRVARHHARRWSRSPTTTAAPTPPGWRRASRPWRRTGRASRWGAPVRVRPTTTCSGSPSRGGAHRRRQLLRHLQRLLPTGRPRSGRGLRRDVPDARRRGHRPRLPDPCAGPARGVRAGGGRPPPGPATRLPRHPPRDGAVDGHPARRGATPGRARGAPAPPGLLEAVAPVRHRWRRWALALAAADAGWRRCCSSPGCTTASARPRRARGLAAACWPCPGTFVIDVLEVAVMLRGSIRERALVL